MALTKPRFGGAQYSMDEFQQTFNATTMAKQLQVQNSSTSDSKRGSDNNKNSDGLEVEKSQIKDTDVGYKDLLGSSSVTEKISSFTSWDKSAAINDESFCLGDSICRDKDNHPDPQCGQSSAQRLEGDGVERLLQVFKTLGIQAQPKPHNPRGFGTRAEYSGSSGEPHLDLRQSENVSPHLSAEGEDGQESPEEEPIVKYCKNLFLKDRRGQFYIVVCEEEDSVDLKILKRQLNAHRNLSFADDNALRSVLQLAPGGVTPLAVMHNSAQDVRVAVYSKLAERENKQPGVQFAFHPLCGHLQVDLAYAELVRFLEHFGKTVDILSGESLTSFRQKKTSPSKSETFPPGLKTERVFSSTNNSIKHKTYSTKNACEQKDNTSKSSQSDKALQEDNTSTEKVDKLAFAKTNSPGSELSSSNSFNSLTLTDVPATGNPNEAKPLKPSGRVNLVHDSSVCEHSTTHTTCSTIEVSLEAPNDGQIRNEEPNVKASPKEVESGKQIRDRPNKITFLSRKGKLRSYIKRASQTDSDSVTTGDENPEHCKVDNEGEAYGDPVSDTFLGNSDSHESNQRVTRAGKGTRNNTQDLNPTVSLMSIHDCNILEDDRQTSEQTAQGQKISSDKLEDNQESNTITPEAERFYSTLSDSGAKFQEIDLSAEGGGAVLGPSVGCRCFLMKDKQNNYSFIVSHELYEPDFGRLKAALRPKKKLILAHPADFILVLGVNPSRLSPFAVLTSREPTPNVYFTMKIMSPKLVLCIQHPYKQAHRILMTSSELQKYFLFLGTPFGVVEERQWASRFNHPFSQFEDAQVESNETAPHSQGTASHTPATEIRGIVETTPELDPKATQGDISEVNMGSHQQTTTLRSLSLSLQRLVYSFEIPRSLTLPFSHLAQYTFPSGTQSSTNPATPSEDLFCSSGSSVDSPILQIPQDSQVLPTPNTHKPSETHIPNMDTEFLYATATSMTTADLEQHLLDLGITFEMRKERSSDAARKRNTASEITDNEEKNTCRILEHCAIMHLTNSAGHNFVIVGAHDDFPMSVKRFCRRCRIREHLDIREDPQVKSESENYVLSDIAPGMMPFSLASSALRSMIWARFTSTEEADRSRLTSHSYKQPQTLPLLGEQSSEVSTCPEVTIVLTTTLYIDPETNMEFTVGPERSRLRVTSAEFERYSRAVGFEVLYY